MLALFFSILAPYNTKPCLEHKDKTVNTTADTCMTPLTADVNECFYTLSAFCTFMFRFDCEYFFKGNTLNANYECGCSKTCKNRTLTHTHTLTNTLTNTLRNCSCDIVILVFRYWFTTPSQSFFNCFFASFLWPCFVFLFVGLLSHDKMHACCV